MKDIMPKDEHLLSYMNIDSDKKFDHMAKTLIEDNDFHKDKEIQKKLPIIRNKYNDYLKDARVILFEQGEVEDFRRLAIFGPSFRSSDISHSKAQPETIKYIGVRENGKYSQGNINIDYLKGHDHRIDIIAQSLLQNKIKTNNFRYDSSFYFLFDKPVPDSFSIMERAFDVIEDINPYGNPIYDILIKINIGRMNQAKDMIIESVDKKILDILNDSGMNDSISLTKINGDHLTDEIAQARQQAVEIYPVFGRNMLYIDKISTAIEKRTSLSSAIAQFFECDQKRIKRLIGIKSTDGHHTNHKKVKHILDLPHSLLPQDKKHLNDIMIMEKYMSLLYRGDDFIKAMKKMAKRGDPWRYIERMKQHRIADVRDSLQFLHRKLFGPAYLNKVKNYAEEKNLIWCQEPYKNLPYNSYRMIYEQLNIKHILDLSERYHANIFHYEDVLNDNKFMGKIIWKPMIGDIDFDHGYRAKELHSFNQLKQQGEDQNHCVGGYTKLILDGKYDSYDEKKINLIFSIEKNKDIKSTLHIECHAQMNQGESLGIKPFIVQHRSMSNNDPDIEVTNIANQLLEHVSSLPLKSFENYVNQLNYANHLYDQSERINHYVKTCGYNPFDRHRLENAWNELRIYLPDKIRRASLDEFIESMPIKEQEFYESENGEVNFWEEENLENRDHLHINEM